MWYRAFNNWAQPQATKTDISCLCGHIQGDSSIVFLSCFACYSSQYWTGFEKYVLILLTAYTSHQKPTRYATYPQFRQPKKLWNLLKKNLDEDTGWWCRVILVKLRSTKLQHTHTHTSMRTLGICQLRHAPAPAHLVPLPLPTYAPPCTVTFATASSKSHSRCSCPEARH